MVVLTAIHAYCGDQERLVEIRRDAHSDQIVVMQVSIPDNILIEKVLLRCSYWRNIHESSNDTSSISGQ